MKKTQQLKTLLSKPGLLVVILSTLTYLLFFYKLLLPNYWIYGSDAETKHYPSRQYFFDKVVGEKEFPFWTEKTYSGFPIYKEPEVAYLNPINTVSILLFGPSVSYKILHFVSYLLGSFSLWVFLKNKGSSIFGWFGANIIYYFSFFLLNHQIHFNLIMSAYLLPVALLLVDKFSTTRGRKEIIIFSLLFSYITYWGSYQIMALMLLGSYLLLFFTMEGKKKFKSILGFIFLSLFIILSLSLPAILSARDLMSTSVRDESFQFSEGAYYPPLFANVFLPFIFGNFEHYFGRTAIGTGYSYTEMYTYFGVTSVILALFSILLITKNRITYYSYFLILLFVVLSSIGIFSFSKYLPLINIFRHWERSSLLGVLGAALLVSSFISNFKEIDYKEILKKRTLILIGSIALYFILLIIFTKNSYTSEITFKHIVPNGYYHKIWIFLFVSSILVSLLVRLLKDRKTKIAFPLLVCLLLLIDLRYYGNDVINTRVVETNNVVPIVKNDGFDRVRVIDAKSKFRGLQFLNSNSYSIFGYSQLVGKNYYETLKKYGYDGRIVAPEGDLYLNDELTQVFGIRAIIEKSRIILADSYPEEFIVKKNEEQHKIIEVNSDVEQVLTSYACDNDWVVKQSRRVLDYGCTNSLFMEIYGVSSDGGPISIDYVPKSLYLRMSVSVTLTILAIELIKKTNLIS